MLKDGLWVLATNSHHATGIEMALAGPLTVATMMVAG